MTSTESQACTPAGAKTHAREAGDDNSATAADAATLFLGLLTQATAPPPDALALQATLAVAAQDAKDDGATDETPVDWVMPFLPPLPGMSPPPIDLELPAPDAGGDAPLAGITADAGDASIVPLPVLLDDTHGAKDAGTLAGPDPARVADASVSAATVAAPRIEAAGSGAMHAVVRHVAVPVSDNRWAEHVGHEVRILVERGVQGATLRLSPEHLGPVDVRIDIVNDKANVVFGAANADTRAALTDAIPKLREMFAGAGLTLGDAGVRQETPGGSAGSSPRDARFDGRSDPVEGEPLAAVTAVRLSLVDAYA